MPERGGILDAHRRSCFRRDRDPLCQRLLSGQERCGGESTNGLLVSLMRSRVRVKAWGDESLFGVGKKEKKKERG